MIRRLYHRLRGDRCPICRSHCRFLPVHIRIDHAEATDAWYLRGSDE